MLQLMSIRANVDTEVPRAKWQIEKEKGSLWHHLPRSFSCFLLLQQKESRLVALLTIRLPSEATFD